MAARFLFLCFRIRLERDQEETKKRPERDQKETWKRPEREEKRRRKVKSGDLADFQAFLRDFRLLSRLYRPVRTRMTRTDSGGPSILSDSAECRRLCENMIKYNGKNISVAINILKSVKSDGAAFLMEWKPLNLQEKPYAAKSIWRSFSDGRILRVLF